MITIIQKINPPNIPVFITPFAVVLFLNIANQIIRKIKPPKNPVIKNFQKNLKINHIYSTEATSFW